MGKFSDQIKAFNKEFESLYRATARIAVQETVEMAQRVHKKGGRMRVKTGFLRASIQGALHGMPSGPTTNIIVDAAGNATVKEYPVGDQVAGEPIAVALLKWDPVTGGPFFVGWTANYARHREAQDGFLRGAVEVWDQTVARVAKRVAAGGHV